MKNNKLKKALLLSGLVLALIAVAVVNYFIGVGANDDSVADSDDPEVEDAIQADDLAVMSSGDYIADYRENRESVRNTELAQLDSIIDNEKSDMEEVKDAQQQKIELVQIMESELKIEGLLASSGFSDAIVVIKTGSVNVVVGQESITAEQAAQILEIVREQTGEPAQNIKILLQG